MSDQEKNTVIIYHGDCTDGYTGSYVAWKKFGDNAIYIGAKDRLVPPENLEGKDVYIIDYSYPKDVLLDLEKKTNKLVILDHHISAKDDVISVKEHVFDNEHCGSYIASRYFFPDEKVPALVEYVEDGDLYKFVLPNSRAILSYLYSQEYSYELFTELQRELEDINGLNKIIDYGNLLSKEHAKMVNYFAERAEKVIFEGYEIYASNANKIVVSDLGHILAEKTNSFSLIYYYDEGKMKCSLRGNGSVDVSIIAGKYGGGGHHNASGFIIAMDNHPLSCVKRIN